jgi:hypothetical protein
MYYFMVGFCCGNGETGGGMLFFNVQEIPPLLEMTILVMDGNTGTVGLGGLFRVHPATGGRRLLSDFGDPAQGPWGMTLVAWRWSSWVRKTRSPLP